MSNLRSKIRKIIKEFVDIDKKYDNNLDAFLDISLQENPQYYYVVDKGNKIKIKDSTIDKMLYVYNRFVSLYDRPMSIPLKISDPESDKRLIETAISSFQSFKKQTNLRSYHMCLNIRHSENDDLGKKASDAYTIVYMICSKNNFGDTFLRESIEKEFKDYNPYKNHGNHSYQKANKKNTHLDKPTSHSYMSGENKDWLGKGPVNKVIYDYLKSLGMIE